MRKNEHTVDADHVDLVNGMTGEKAEAASRGRMRRLRREVMALWPFLVLQCVSMIGIMAEGRLLLIELMMPSPDWTKPPNGKEPIIEPISPPDVCVDFPTAIGCPGAPVPMPQEARNSGIRDNSWENDDLDLSELGWAKMSQSTGIF